MRHLLIRDVEQPLIGVGRYHCRWQASRERSSMTPNRIGVNHSPPVVRTFFDP
jgi:hypothetical protein